MATSIRIMAALVVIAVSVAAQAAAMPDPEDTAQASAEAETLDLTFPARAMLAAQSIERDSGALLPVSPWTPGGMRTHAPGGTLVQQAWQLPGAALSTAELAAPLERQLGEAGYEIVFSCKDDACGGFDFRYAAPVLPEPQMHVDLGDFRYIAARRGVSGGIEGEEMVALMISRSPASGYVQVTRLGPAGAAQTVTSTKSGVRDVGSTISGAVPVAKTVSDGSLAAQLAQAGRAPLDDLTFLPGASELGGGPFASLRQLADYLDAHPGAEAVLVGHSDSRGGLERNITLSEARARAVMQRLSAELDVPAARLRAEGVGYLAPRSGNETPEGRAANRRVEVVLLPESQTP